MKRKLTDAENESVIGGATDCTAEQDAKVNSGICPFCGGRLTGNPVDSMIRKSLCGGSCGRIYYYNGDGHWRASEPAGSSGC